MRPKLLTFFSLLTLALGLIVPATNSFSDSLVSSDRVDLFSTPSLPSGENLNDFYLKNNFNSAYREIIPLAEKGNTYYAILGSLEVNPSFYGGIQVTDKGEKYAIFSVWDVGSDNCSNCSDPNRKVGQVSLIKKGPKSIVDSFGGEGTGKHVLVKNFNWQVGKKVSMLVKTYKYRSGIAYSAAIQIQGEPWLFLGSFYAPQKNLKPMPCNYGFVEDWTGEPKLIKRKVEFFPVLITNSKLKTSSCNKFDINISNVNPKELLLHQIVTKSGGAILVTSGISPQKQSMNHYLINLRTNKLNSNLGSGLKIIALNS